MKKHCETLLSCPPKHRPIALFWPVGYCKDRAHPDLRRKKAGLQASSLLERVVMSSGNFTAIILLLNNRKTYKHALNGNCNCILFTKLPWSGDSKRIFQSSSEAATCPSTHLSTTHIGEAFTLPLFIAKTSSRKIVFTNFYGLWFDLTGNQTRV